MKGITIQDNNEGEGFLNFDLIDILKIIGERAIKSNWLCKHVECQGEMADVLHTISDSQEIISGKKLVEIASGIMQIIDGMFLAFNNEKNKPWLIISAIDSSYFDVEVDDIVIMEKLTNRFHKISYFDILENQGLN